VSTELGLRDRKKQRTRTQIAESAFELFADRGFDAVPVAEIARASEVSVATVFNYFHTKEALVYSGMESFEAELLTAIADRPDGMSVIDAFRDVAVRPRGLLASDDPAGLDRIATVARIIRGSATLRAREREIFDQTTGKLATLIAEQSGADDDFAPWVVANALVGVHRAMKDYLHSQLLAGRRDRRLTQDLLAHGTKALDVLERGLTDTAATEGTASAAGRRRGAE
jgi:AcrR family transcriptional regulator